MLHSRAVMHVAALVGYDGSAYNGFQVQANAPTIQGTLERSLAAFASVQGRIVGAGRTDTGVHARGQVISLTLQWRHGVDALQRAWNAHLPPDIVIRQVAVAPDGFHPRFCAERRTYRYFVRTGALREPLSSRYRLDLPSPLDLEAMQAAALALLGTHDFATFGTPPQGENTVRTAFAAQWQVERTNVTPLGLQDERRLVFTITANAFLQHMVRKVVGSLLEVGRGRWSVPEFISAFKAAQGARSAPPAAPAGLVFEWVTYPEPYQLFGGPGCENMDAPGF